jgi:hypothetical protein
MSVTELYPEHITRDLAKSGLTIQDVRARVLGPNEKHATNVPMSVDGYVLPYYNMFGQPIPFYRVKLYDWDPKYKQQVNTPNHIYFPPGFSDNIEEAECIILTEGEKKAACAVKLGYLAAAVSGVDSWRNRTLSMPKETALTSGRNNTVIARLPAGAESMEQTESIATGLKELISLALQRDIPIVIIYDSDSKRGLKYEVAVAAASLGWELRARGIPTKNIRQLVLKPGPQYEAEKIGLDDFFAHPKLGHTAFAEALSATLNATSAFPKHPNPREFVNKKLQRSRISRSEMQAICNAVLCDLDSKGRRLYSPDDERMYYFSNQTHELVPTTFKIDATFPQSPFGKMLYRQYNVGASDFRFIQAFSSQFAGEEPISDVSPERAIAVRNDAVYFQVDNGRMLRVSADRMSLQNNGTDDILFESDIVEPLNTGVLLDKIRQAQAQNRTAGNYWYEALKDSRITTSEGDRARKLLSLLYSISPWFYRWRGTQLPFEMIIGENGSGKSTIEVLRLGILTGKPILRNAPTDLRNWAASIASTGGLHVTDNVHMSASKIKQELSDEICRLITEPDPHIEARMLYTDFKLIRLPVRTVFAVTAIDQPFHNADIIARSIITTLDKGDQEIEYEGDWDKDQLNRFGGREGWIANQMIFIQQMFRLIREKWQPRYKARFRLINVEQLLMLAAEVYGEDGSWIPSYLEGVRQKTTSDSDWALGGLVAFAEEWRMLHGPNNYKRLFTAQTIADWASGQEEYSECTVLRNSRRLGHHMQKNRNTLSQVAGIVQKGTLANRAAYIATPVITSFG